jgi:hypothetical protein
MNTGISEYTSPAGKVNKGALELPKDFETTRYAAKWAKQGAGVSRAMEQTKTKKKKKTADNN